MHVHPADIAAFEHRLGHRFLDRAHLCAALTHASYVNEHRAGPCPAAFGEHDHEGRPRNDDGQYAFLGDAVLDLAVADRLMRREGGKGKLTTDRAEVVRNTHLAQVAARLDLPLFLGKGERVNRDGATTRLSTGFEALIGAVYLDAGPAHAIKVVDRLLERLEAPNP